MKKKVSFILDHKLHQYRVPLFVALSEYYDIKVFHRGPEIDSESNFNQAIVSYKKIGPFEMVQNLPDLSSYDAVVIMQNLRLLNLYDLPLRMRNIPCLMWGIGTSSSKGIGSESQLSIVFRNLVTSKYQGLALYSDIPIPNYWSSNKSKITVVGNSILNEEASNNSGVKKEYILFIGSLNKRKGLNELLSSFKLAVSMHHALQLKIVGDGPERAELEQQILSLGLSQNVELLGAIHDPEIKKQIFAKAYCVISPLQAGLSVVESFSYGVPFVTSTKAITGGESQSIIHEKNGVLFDNSNELSDIICSFLDGRRDSSLLGSNAYAFYKEHLAFELYVQRFKQFIEQHL